MGSHNIMPYQSWACSLIIIIFQLVTISNSSPASLYKNDCTCTYTAPPGTGCKDFSTQLPYSCEICQALMHNETKSMYELCQSKVKKAQPQCWTTIDNVNVYACHKTVQDMITGTVIAVIIIASFCFVCVTGITVCWWFSCLCFTPRVSYSKLGDSDPPSMVRAKEPLAQQALRIQAGCVQSYGTQHDINHNLEHRSQQYQHLQRQQQPHQTSLEPVVLSSVVISPPSYTQSQLNESRYTVIDPRLNLSRSGDVIRTPK
eukprot:m.7668 g.7668  ORF g.7668 m.7668 type:complete len:259 (-) comp3751_c1_seq1:2493-3269(-)